MASMCPHCGKLFAEPLELIPTHDYPKPCRAVCPGSGQHPRNPESDRRPLGNGEPNRHIPRLEEARDALNELVTEFGRTVTSPAPSWNPNYGYPPREGANKNGDQFNPAGCVLSGPLYRNHVPIDPNKPQSLIVVDDPRQAGEPTDEQRAASLKWYEQIKGYRVVMPARTHVMDLPGPIETVDLFVNADGTPVGLSLGMRAPVLEIALDFEEESPPFPYQYTPRAIRDIPAADWDALVNAGAVTVNEYRERLGFPTIAGPEGLEPYNSEPVNGIVALPITVTEAEAAGFFKPGIFNREGNRWNPVNGSTDIHDPANWSNNQAADDDPQPIIRGPAE